MEGQEPTPNADGQTPDADGQTPDADGQTPDADGQTPDAEQTAQTPETKPFDAEYVKTLRAENASYRTKLKGYEKAEEDRKAASLSELEKAHKQATDAAARATATEARLTKRDALDAFKAANVIDADLAYMAIRDQITMEDGEPANILELVAQFVADRPAMVRPADAAKPAAPPTKSTNPAPAASKQSPLRDRF